MAKILLVEDDKNLLEIYGARLMAEGYEIVTAQDGEEGLAVASREHPDLIITDAMMPRVSGLQFLDILRSTPATADIKVIAMTALSQAEDRAQFEKLGVERFLVKSQVTLEDVTRIVSEVLNGSTPPASPDPAAPAADPAPTTDPVVPSQVVEPPATPPSEPTTPPADSWPTADPTPVDEGVVVEPPTPGAPTTLPTAPTDTSDKATPVAEEQSDVEKQIQSFIDTSPLVNTPPAETVAPTEASAPGATVPAPEEPSQPANEPQKIEVQADSDSHQPHPHDIAL